MSTVLFSECFQDRAKSIFVLLIYISKDYTSLSTQVMTMESQTGSMREGSSNRDPMLSSFPPPFFGDLFNKDRVPPTCREERFSCLPRTTQGVEGLWIIREV